MLAGRLPDYERNVLPMHEFEILLELLRQARERAEWLAVLSSTTEPFLLGRVIFQPGIRRGDHKQPTGQNPIANTGQKQGRVVETIDQIAGKHEVIASVERLQIAGVALHEHRPRPGCTEPEPIERHGAVRCEFTLGGDLIEHLASFLEPHPRLDEAAEKSIAST